MQFLHTLLYMLNEMSPYILLGFLLAGLLHVFVKPGVLTRHLSGTGPGAVAKAALFGVPLPLCSCGVLPAAVSLRRSGASRAASTSFLIATPQTGVDSIAATSAMLGPAFAVVRPVAAFVTAMAGGWLVGRAERRMPAGETGQGSVAAADESPAQGRSFGYRLLGALRYGLYDMVQSIGGWLVAGLIIAAVITMLVPDDFFVQFRGHTLLTMLAVVLVAVPMYVCATGSIPIAMSLMLKGLSPGTALVLLMAGPAANFASMTIISRTMGRRCAALYLASIVAGAVAFGLMIDLLLPASWFALPSMAAVHAHASAGLPWFSTACSALLLVLLVVACVVPRLRRRPKVAPDAIYHITGMNCPHCRARVERGLAALEGVTAVTVDLSTGIASVRGSVSADAVAGCVRSLGFDIK